MKRDAILAKAAQLVSGDRAEDYGSWQSNAECLAHMWSAYLGHCVLARDIGPMLALLKIMRLRNGPHEDSSVDACGYLALGGELDSD